MAFNFQNSETDRVIIFNDVEYRVIDESDSGLLIVAKEEDVKCKRYPLSLFAVPRVGDSEY